MENKKLLTINFFGGSYGHFVQAFLTGNIKKNSTKLNENNFHTTNNESSILNINFSRSHDNEKILDEQNLKITYKIEHIDLIVRNVYKKLEDLSKKNINELFSNKDLDNNTHEQIIVIAFYKNSLLHGLTKWNKILKKSTIELPIDYFFQPTKDSWLICWKNIFAQLKIDTTNEYITDAFDIFNETQKILFKEHSFYKELNWDQLDIIGKGNLLGELYYRKHSQNNIPIDIIKYKDTQHMLYSWIDDLNKNLYDKL